MVEDGPNSAAGVRQGDILAGKYRVERVLGIGGMGVVVAAHHLQLDERVALKFLLPDALRNAEAVARFAREARAAVKIKSEHVARVTDVGTLPNGAPYMVMEYLEGRDLDAWVKESGALPVEQAVDFVLQACVAVADAHALGIVHRDLKPANLFCVRRSDGQLSIKVLDFGISKMTDTSGSAPGSMTRTAALMGSPLYMSPEQMRSAKDVDAQTDIWALGIILFELMTGRTAFLADSVMELAIKVTTEPTPSIRSVRPEVPSALEAIVGKCLEKERRQRYGNVAELALALLPFAPSRAKATVDRISGIIDAAGLSAKTFAAPPAAQLAQPMAPQVSAGTMRPVGRTTMGLPARKMTVVGATLSVAAVLVAVAGSAIVWKRAYAHHPESAATTPEIANPGDPHAAAAASPPPAKASTAEPPPSPATANASPPPALAPSAAAPLVSSTVPARPSPRPAGPPVRPAAGPLAAPTKTEPAPPPAASSPPAPAAANCNPPYVIDSAGDRQYKPECL